MIGIRKGFILKIWCLSYILKEKGASVEYKVRREYIAWLEGMASLEAQKREIWSV